MSITYEEALATLESMFGAPWTRDTLDSVLRHFKGHMENTVEAILQHGEQDPELLVEKLKSGASESVDLDQELARQLAAQEQRRSAGRGAGSSSVPASAAPKSAKKGRGTPTELPPDFLRIPGRDGIIGGNAMDQDEALARMLQDELFSQELANNPEFAHLASTARPRMVGGRPTSAARGATQGAAARAGAANHRPFGEEGQKLVEKMADLGQEAKKRLQLFAAQWTAAGNRFSNAGAGQGGSGGKSSNETRGLLDDDDGEEMEMSFAGPPSSKNKNQ